MTPLCGQGEDFAPKKEKFFSVIIVSTPTLLLLFSSFPDIYAPPPSCCILFFFLSLSLLFSEGPWGNILSGGKGRGRDYTVCMAGERGALYRSDIPPAPSLLALSASHTTAASNRPDSIIRSMLALLLTRGHSRSH